MIHSNDNDWHYDDTMMKKSDIFYDFCATVDTFLDYFLAKNTAMEIYDQK